MRIFEMREKEVINIRDCKRLGCVCDIDIDICSGCVLAIIVPGPARIWGIFGHDNEYVIPWRMIRQIGPDIILVDVVIEDVFIKCSY